MRGSAGHIMAKLLLEVNGIPQENLNLVTYNSGGLARAAVAGGVVDFIVISAEGTRGISEYIKPLAIVSERRNPDWDAPTINQALAPLNATTPVLPGSIRGFATTAKFKQDHPQRFARLVKGIQLALNDPELQALLDRSNIGRRWVGPEKAEQTMSTTFEYFKNYSYLLKIQ
ncbi:MAG: hypothetical protein JKX81_02615 [Arenicella sp.]|nr:hypothetical protein [Arenicella sp.]